jgi:cytochrome c oxidase subunit 4
MQDSNKHETGEHVVPIKTYAIICASLLVLTFLTYRIAYIDLGALNVACFKASLVVLFFMHAAYAPRRTRMVILAGIFWMMILLGLTLADYLTLHLPR